jgi:hypothetical protein
MEQKKKSSEKPPEGIYSNLLPSPDSQYAVAEYHEERAQERPDFSTEKPVVEGREIDAEGNLRRLYFVNAGGDIIEIQEFGAHPFKNEREHGDRTLYKNGKGELIAVRTRTVAEDKERGESGYFWEWNRENGSVWDPIKIEKGESHW